ncbi:MAG: hypothetical protein IKH75_01310 [Ruminococcus sp.]|nr:hypothetical protein [Ruminococcus sp.]
MTLLPGAKFQTTDDQMKKCTFQYLGIVEGIGGRDVYIHDLTHDRYFEVSKRWFHNRIVLFDNAKYA